MIAEVLCMAFMSLGLANSDVACDNMQLIVDESENNNIDPSLIVGLIYVESRFNPKAKSWANACGLMQILPRYSKKYGGKDRNLTCDELKDPKTSITTGTKILKFWKEKYARGKIKTALCGYNAGFRCKGPNRNKKGMSYARKVLKYQTKIKREYNKIFKDLKKD